MEGKDFKKISFFRLLGQFTSQGNKQGTLKHKYNVIPPPCQSGFFLAYLTLVSYCSSSAMVSLSFSCHDTCYAYRSRQNIYSLTFGWAAEGLKVTTGRVIKCFSSKSSCKPKIQPTDSRCCRLVEFLVFNSAFGRHSH